MADAWTALANSTAHLPGLGMGMLQLQGNREDRALGMQLRQDEANMRNEIAERTRATAQQQADIHAQQLAAQTPKYKQVMNPSMISSAEVATGKAFGKDGVDVMRPLFDMAREVAAADPGSTFGDNYAAVKSAWPSMREEVAANIQKKLESGKLNPDQYKKLSALYDSVMYDKDGSLVLDKGIYLNTKSSMDMEEANSLASREAMRQEGLNARADQRDERIRELAEENRALKREKMGGGGKDKPKEPKAPTGIDFKRLNDMIAKANEKSDGPESDDIEMISGAADKLGYAYVPYEEKGQLRGVPGTSMFDFRTGAKKGYKLVSVKTPDDVKKAFQQGLLTEEQATGILQSKHGFK